MTCRSDETHFLRIDVGGAERDVLLGADFTTFRPWIIVAAVGSAGSGASHDAGWQELLDVAGYDRTLFDGVSLWFLAREHAYLRDRLEAPPNIRDGYLPARLDRVEGRLVSMMLQIADAKANIAKSQAMIATLVSERAEVDSVFRAFRIHADSVQKVREILEAEVPRLSERHNLETAALKNQIREFDLRLEFIKERLELEIASQKQGNVLQSKRHRDEINDAQRQLMGLAYHKTMKSRLIKISDLTGTGRHLERRGAELLELRAGLLWQADAWRREVEHLQMRLNDAISWSNFLQASTSWRLTSPLRRLRQVTHVLRREPRRLRVIA